MEITLTTPAMLFPAVTLLLLAYTNRFLAIANTVRILHRRYISEERGSSMLLRQIANLRRRLILIRYMQLVGVVSLITCLCSVAVLFGGMQLTGKFLFGGSMALMLVSLLICLCEVYLSGRAMDIELEDMQEDLDGR